MFPVTIRDCGNTCGVKLEINLLCIRLGLSIPHVRKSSLGKYISHKIAKVNECPKENCSIDLLQILYGSLRTIIFRLENSEYLQN